MPATMRVLMRVVLRWPMFMALTDPLDGQTATADEAYLRESILNPSQHITQGYAPIMPTYQGQISEEGVIALVEYIKNLDSNYRVQQTLNTTDLLPESEGKKVPLRKEW